MAVAFDTSAATVNNSASPITATLTVGAGSNRVLAVVFSTPDALTVTSISGAGATWPGSAFATSTDGAFKFELWYGTNPSTGSQTVTVNFSGTPATDHAIGVWSFNGVDQTTPLANYVHGVSATVSVTAGSQDGAVSSLSDTAALRTLSGCTTTRDWFTAPLSDAYHGAHCSGPNPTFTWSGISGGAIGAAVAAAGGGGSVVKPRLFTLIGVGS